MQWKDIVLVNDGQVILLHNDVTNVQVHRLEQCDQMLG